MLTDLLRLNQDELTAFMVTMGEKPYRARQIFEAIHRLLVADFSEITNISKELRAQLKESAYLNNVILDKVHVSSDGTRKYQFRTHDKHIIESVFIPDASSEGRNTICISSQIGCAMGCTFCATAAMNLIRNLDAAEIVSQVYCVLRDLKANHLMLEDERGIHNIVYMGMGEPLHNYENVVCSVRLLTNDHGTNFSARRITVSTSGLVKNIIRLGNDTNVQIAISLNATTNPIRDRIMPVNRKWNIEELLGALKDFPLQARRRLFFEYVMLAGINDSDDDAKRLIKLLRDFRCKVNLIPFNSHPLSPYKRPAAERVLKFQSIVRDSGITVFVRTTRGDDIDAACGMLGAKKLEEARNEHRSSRLDSV